MRKKVIAGNWKMYKDVNESIEFVKELVLKQNNIPDNVDVIICTPFTSLYAVSQIVKDSKIMLGAQNMFYEDLGAYTGEISPLMLKSTGCKYVILGHSERRTYFGETDDIVNKKVKKAIEKDLTPIMCIGETLQERESGITNQIVEKQVRGGLNGLSPEEISKIIIAYEPVWAIGTGKTATPAQAQDVHKFIRDLISKISNDKVASNLIIQYGGSMKPENAKELLSQPDIDGGLIGGACLKVDSFYGIITA
ncbi:MAG TPA: triose-phosphate isomerase [Bacteroidota bacterium]|jgi:triosephosphate isomerase|nr:triose-phosphate isomerase [Bacteroidota bacterium]